MSYVCAYSSAQLDKRRVEKEFTLLCKQLSELLSMFRAVSIQYVIRYVHLCVTLVLYVKSPIFLFLLAFPHKQKTFAVLNYLN